MGLCIPREYQTLSSFETNVLLAYKLQPALQASTTNAFLCVCSQNFLTTRPHSVRNNMFIVQIMYRRCNFNVTFSKQKLLDINIKAVWLNGLYCELVDLADVDIVLRHAHVPSWHLGYPIAAIHLQSKQWYRFVQYCSLCAIRLRDKCDKCRGWKGGGVTNSRLPWLHLNLYPMFIVCLLPAFLTIGNAYMQYSYMYQYFLDWGQQNP